MKDGGLASLRKSLVTHYDRLKRRLSARLGNDELAGDALQDAYLKLDGVAAPEAVRQPEAYIYRMAFHIAADYARSGDERLTRAEADEILGLTPDAAPGPAQIAEDRQALHTLMRALERMPERQREILLAARLDGVTQKELAARHGISVRMVERELQHAQAYCRARLPYSGRIDDFQPLLQIGRQGAGQRGRGLGAAHPVRAGHAARRAGVGNGARTATHAAAFERARRAWVDIGQAGRAFRAAHPRGGAGAARPPGAAARGPGRGAAAAAAARRWAGGPAWKDWARTTARRWASSARSTGAAGRPWSNWTPAPA